MKDLRDALKIMQTSAIHKTWGPEEIDRCIVTPLELSQYSIITENNEPVVFGTWGFPTEKHIEEYLETQKFPIEGYKSQGKDVWMIDFISKKDYTFKGVRYFKYLLDNKGYNKALWFRVNNLKISWHKWKGK